MRLAVWPRRTFSELLLAFLLYFSRKLWGGPPTVLVMETSPPQTPTNRRTCACAAATCRRGAAATPTEAAHEPWLNPRPEMGWLRKMPTKKAIQAAADLIDGYRPRDEAARELFQARHDEFITAVPCLQLHNRAYATTALGLAIRYALDLEAEGIWDRSSNDPVPFTHRWVTRYSEKRQRAGKKGAETSQWMLSAIGRAYQPHLWPRPSSTRRVRDPRAPYGEHEQEDFTTFASQYRAVYGDARIEATVAAGFGGGLAPEDFRVVRGSDVRGDAHGDLCIRVAGGRLLDRTVPVLPEWSELLADAADAMGAQLLVSGTHDNTRNLTERVTVPLRKLGGPPLGFRRMRSTWLIGRLAAGVPERVLREFAGLNDSATFSFLDPHFPLWNEADRRRWIQHGGRPC